MQKALKKNKIKLTDDDVIRDYAVIQSSVEKIFSEENLIRVIKVLSSNPFIEMKVYENTNTPFTNLGKELATQCSVDKESYQRDKRERELKESLNELFGDQPIMKMEGYTSQYSAELRKYQLTGFLYITPIRILKTFLEKFYYTHIDETFDSVFREMEFISEDFKADVMRLHTELKFVGESIKKFEEDIISPGFWDIRPYFKKSDEGSLTDSDRSVGTKLINRINKRAEQ